MINISMEVTQKCFGASVKMLNITSALSQFNKEDSQSQKMVIKENDEKNNTNESISGDDEALDDY